MEQFVLIPFSLYQKRIESFPDNSLGLLDVKLSRPAEIPEVPGHSYQLDRIHTQLKKHLRSANYVYVDTLLKSQRIKLSESDTIILDDRDTFVPIVDFIVATKQKHKSLPDVYFTILHASDLNPSFVKNQDAKSTDRGNWVPFHI